MIAKAWRRLPTPPAGFSASMGLPAFHAHLLYNRGIRQRAEIEPFLKADSRLLNDPMLLPDMDKAVARLRNALRSDETIGIFGDFDTDGITGTALLARALRDLGANVITYIPDRVDEGHGLNEQAIRLLSDNSVSLLFTVDCGVTSIDEIDFAASLGMDTRVNDHHTLPQQIPNAGGV
ncbi:MAG: DHH family phosphoesterase, partial [Chloroflexi bacterium]|nr:DHH family phosphoesterase [Chloroflexota bacterium]